MTEIKKEDPSGINNVKSHPESELDSVGVNTYMYDKNDDEHKMHLREIIVCIIQNTNISLDEIGTKIRKMAN